MEKCSVCEKHVDEVERIVLHTDFNVCNDCNKLINERYFVGALKELRKTKRALWLARAERASSEKAHYYIMSTYCKHHSNKQKWMKRISFTWEKVERKCREKAEEYK